MVKSHQIHGCGVIVAGGYAAILGDRFVKVRAGDDSTYLILGYRLGSDDDLHVDDLVSFEGRKVRTFGGSVVVDQGSLHVDFRPPVQPRRQASIPVPPEPDVGFVHAITLAAIRLTVFALRHPIVVGRSILEAGSAVVGLARRIPR